MVLSSGAENEDEQTLTSSRSKRDRPARKYGFACGNCRRRKVRCDGGLPSCDRCIANRQLCYFNKGPSVAYSIALQNQLDAYESLLDRLRDTNDTERLQILEEHFSHDVNRKRKRSPYLEVAPQLPDSPRSDGSVDEEMTELLNETSVGEDGQIYFYGTTSLFHLRPDQPARSRPQAPSRTSDSVSGSSEETTQTLPYSSHLSLRPPVQADIQAYLQTDISSDVCNELLETYWCWPHNIHLVLCRKIFMRDLINSGPYVTPFLLNAVLAQAARYSDRPDAAQLGAYFSQRTIDAMAAEVNKGSSIPTIQALLILSGLECTCGRSSQGWLYSGMAFRMMRDLGMHIHSHKLSLVGHYPPVELALRQQILWSCYTWDKVMSLCLGRAPTIYDVVPLPTTESMLDGEEAEEEPWTPRFSTVSVLEVGVSQKAKTNSRFVAYCQLCVIIDDILGTLYYPRAYSAPQQHLQRFLDRSIENLDSWARNLPSHLYIGEDCRSVPCPPLHILLLNLLYRATIILLCRPYRSRLPRAKEMATAAANMIDRLFMLHIRRFGFRIVTYLESYTMFVASTINILDLKEGIDADGASGRLYLSLEVLRNATSTPSDTGCVTATPSNARCVEIIQELLRQNTRPRGLVSQSEETRNSERGFCSQGAGTDILQQPPHRRSPPTATTHNSQYFLSRHDLLSSVVPLTSPTAPVSRIVDFPFFNSPNVFGMGDLPDTFFNQENPPSGFLPTSAVSGMAMPGAEAVETPLPWLPSYNGNGDPNWMRTDMDFDAHESHH